MPMIIFATLDPAGAPVQLPRGEPFTTYHVIVATEQEAAWSFKPIGQRAAFEINHAPDALDRFSDAELARFTIQKVAVDDPPAGQRVASVTLIEVEGEIVADPVFEPVPPPPVPLVISRMQAKLALHAEGLLDDVDAAVAAAPREVQIYWAEVSELHRDHAILNQMTEALGWTSEQVDDLFRAAAAIF